MNKELVAFLLDENGEWYIGLTGKGIRKTDEHYNYRWIYRGMELWNAHQEDGVNITVNRTDVEVDVAGFGPKLKASLEVKMTGYKIVGARLVYPPLGITLIDNLTSFTFEAFV